MHEVKHFKSYWVWGSRKRSKFVFGLNGRSPSWPQRLFPIWIVRVPFNPQSSGQDSFLRSGSPVAYRHKLASSPHPFVGFPACIWARPLTCWWGFLQAELSAASGHTPHQRGYLEIPGYPAGAERQLGFQNACTPTFSLSSQSPRNEDSGRS